MTEGPRYPCRTGPEGGGDERTVGSEPQVLGPREDLASGKSQVWCPLRTQEQDPTGEVEDTLSVRGKDSLDTVLSGGSNRPLEVSTESCVNALRTVHDTIHDPVLRHYMKSLSPPLLYYLSFLFRQTLTLSLSHRPPDKEWYPL